MYHFVNGLCVDIALIIGSYIHSDFSSSDIGVLDHVAKTQS